MSVLARAVRRPERRAFDGDWDSWVSGDTSLSDTAMSRDKALRLSAVWRCVHLVSETVGGFPAHAVQRSNGARIPVDNQPVILSAPALNMSGQQWRAAATLSLLLHGNAWGIITDRNRAGWPTQIELLDPLVVTTTERFGSLSVLVNGSPIDGAELWHLPGLPSPGARVGMSPLAAAARSMGLSAEASEMAEDYYSRGGHPTSLLASTDALTDAQATTAKSRFKAATASDHLAVLGGGWSYEAIQASPADAMFLAAIRATDVDICRFFGVPAEMIGAAASGSSVTYANREQRALDFLTFTILPWVIRIEDALSAISPGNQRVKLNPDGLLRTDPETTAKILDKRIRNGTIHRDAVRALYDEPPIEGDGGTDYVWPPAGVTTNGDAPNE